MLSDNAPRAQNDFPASAAAPAEPEPVALEAPEYLVQRYLELSAQRKQIEDQLAFVRSELELLAAPSLKDGAAPRGRFVSPAGAIHVRLQPTCVFDRGEVARILQKEGVLPDVATLNAVTLARYLRHNPRLAARLGDTVRYRNGIVMTTAAL